MTSECTSCGSLFRVHREFGRWAWLLVVSIVALVGFATHGPDSGGIWMLGLFVLAVPLAILVYAVLPAKLEKGNYQSGLTLIGAIYSMGFALVIEFVIYGAWAATIGNQRDVREFFEIFSLPLGFFDKNFVIRPGPSFLNTCGIIFGNSLIWGTLLYMAGSAVRLTRRKSATIRMGIADSSRNLDEDEE